MNKIATFIMVAMMALAGYSHPVNTNSLSITYTNTPSEWLDFDWAWSAGSDQALKVDVYGQQPSNLFFRLSRPNGYYYLTTQAGSFSDYSTFRRWYSPIPKTNIPPTGVYRAEILSSSTDDTNFNAATSVVLARGRVRTQWSSYGIPPFGGTSVWLQVGAGSLVEQDLLALAALNTYSGSMDLAHGVINTNIINTGAGATNIALAIGAGATNLALGVGVGATNLALAIGAGATSLVAGASAAASNYTDSAITSKLAAANTYTGTFNGVFTGDGSGLSGLSASATNSVDSISLTGAVRGELTFVGDGITQTGTTFNFNGFGTAANLLSAWATASNAASSALALGAGATNLSLAIGAGGTNLALAIGAGATGLTLSAWATASNAASGVITVGSVATNAQVTASNAYTAATGAAAVAAAAYPASNPSNYLSGTGATFTNPTFSGTANWSDAGAIKMTNGAANTIELGQDVGSYFYVWSTYGSARLGDFKTLGGEVELVYAGITNWIGTLGSNFVHRDQAGNSYTFWTSGSDGSSSGLDADLLDGYTATDFALISTLTNYLRRTMTVPTTPTNTGTRNTYAITNGYIYLYEANVLGSGTNWGRIALEAWSP